MSTKFDLQLKALADAHGIDNFVFQGMHEAAESSVTLISGNHPIKLLFLADTLNDSVKEAMEEAVIKAQTQKGDDKSEAIRELIRQIME
jgi:hypothetical protein